MGIPAVDSAPIEAWYINDSTEDQRLPHHLNPKQYVSLEKLTELGVLNWALDADNYEHDSELQKIRQERGYTYHDIVDVAPDKLPNYEMTSKAFYEEHIHTDNEETIFVLEGSGYFDVRDFDGRWIRIWTKKGALIILPAGIYHRFTLDECNYVKVFRLSVGEPVWTP